VGSVSPRRGAVERVHLSEALEAVVEKVLFSALGEHVVDSLFKGMSVQSVPNTCTCTLCPCVSTGSTCGKARVHWKRDDGGEEPREVARPENHPEKEEAFHFREIGYARWDSREDESRQKRDHAWRSSSPDLSPTGKFDKTHISIPANEDLAAARDSPWNKTGKSDEMPRFSHTVWSENLSKTPGGANCSLSHTRGTHNTSIVENIEASPSCTRHLHLTRTRQTDHNVSITEVLNVSLSEGPANASIVSEDDAPVRIDDTPRAERASEHGFGVGGDDGRGVEYGGGRGHRRGKSIDGNCCILEDLDMADSETGEVFVDRGYTAPRKHTHNAHMHARSLARKQARTHMLLPDYMKLMCLRTWVFGCMSPAGVSGEVSVPRCANGCMLRGPWMVRSLRTTGKRRMREMRKMPLFVPSANACSRFVLSWRETGREEETCVRARDWGILVSEAVSLSQG